jgi:hypothetical protein
MNAMAGGGFMLVHTDTSHTRAHSAAAAAVPPPSPLQLSDQPTRWDASPVGRATSTDARFPAGAINAAVDVAATAGGEMSSAPTVSPRDATTPSSARRARRAKPPPPRRVVSFAPSAADPEQAAATAQPEGPEDT